MKYTLGIVVFCLTGTALAAQVQGYVRKDGTYVAPHMRTNPNSNRMDNYSSQGNINPYTGQQGTVNPYSGPLTSSPSYLPPPPPMYTPEPSYAPYRP